MSIFAAIGHSARLFRAVLVMAREGAFNGIDSQQLPPAGRPLLALAKLLARKESHDPKAQNSRLAVAFARLGPSYVKLGQFLATRPDVVGADVVRDLEALQDRVGPFPQEQAVKIIEHDFERPLHEIYQDFGPPVASASIAQVHRAIVRYDGVEQAVAVKISRPGIERSFKRDLSDMYFAARMVDLYSNEAERLRPVEVVDTLARSVKMEMDFRLEAAAASEFGENVANDPGFRIPKVDWNRTARDVLTLEWVDGIPLTDHAALLAAGHDLPTLGRIVIQSFLRHALRDGFFHADMHQGNLFVDRDGNLVAVDFGIMGRLGAKERRFLGEILYGFITRDYRRVAQVHFDAGYVPPIHQVEDFAQAIRAIGEPIHSRTADQISMARLLTLLFEVTALFDMKTRTELVMLQKTMVVVEGVARSLDSHLDIWSTAEPVVRVWIEDTLGPVGKIRDASEYLTDLITTMGNVPKLLRQLEVVSKTLDSAAAQGLPAAQRATTDAMRLGYKASMWATVALWLIALCIGLVLYKIW